LWVGRALVELQLPEGGNLKDKRRVIKGLIARVRQRYEVACAEVDRQDDHGRATIGVAVVSNDAGHARAVLNTIEGYLVSNPDVVVLEYEVEIS
jgi:uncharacterized protein